jgi:hypothetical protein
MKLTKPERIGASQLIPGVRATTWGWKMARVVVLAVVLGVVGCSAASGESIIYEAAATIPGVPRQIIANGVRDYSPKHDVVARERDAKKRGVTSWSKSLLLNDDWALTADVVRERQLEGFGLMVQRRGDANGFSWEWFVLDAGQVFRKLQGSGRVSVTTIKGPGYEELGAVEFLDDIVLRYLDDMAKPPGTHTHELLVRKGSILKLAP